MATTDEPRADSTESKLDQLQQLRDEAEHAGTDKAIERQRQQGKLLARERLVELLDPGSFVELDRYVRHREPNFSARSITLQIFSAKTSLNEPPKTVKSCEKTKTLRPKIVP